MHLKFYDTSSLLLKANHLLEEENFIISSITLNELEEIKNSNNKDTSIKYAARHILNILNEHPEIYTVWIFTVDMLDIIIDKNLSVNNDTKILATAIDYKKRNCLNNLTFITNDLALKSIAKLFFNKDNIESVQEEYDDYEGYREVILSNEEMAYFYSNINSNIFNLYINQYLIIKNQENIIVDSVCWDGITHRHITYATLKSNMFGNIKPYKDDIYQALFVDSLVNNQITLVKGPAGSGKTMLSLAFLMKQLEEHKIDKIIVFCNTIATKGSAKLGFYPGTRDEKLLDSQIGNLLISKFGSRIMVEDMINSEKLVLLPLSDIRGYDTNGMRAGIYISEAQNMDINLMKLTLQRIGEDSICIIDGDVKSQVDDIEFSGVNNGMRRVSKVFRGEDIYGEICLKNIHRSKIARIAENL